MNDSIHDYEAEDFICRAYKLLNGVVNPNNPVPEIRFVDYFQDMPLGCVALGIPDNLHIAVGSKNVKDFVDEIGRDNAYMYFIDFIVHELYHAAQNIDLPRYANDEEYNDLIETDCEYHSTLFILNYSSWILDRLGLSFLQVNYNPTDTFKECKREDLQNQKETMSTDPWIISF